jgi:hypothetical protein
MRNSNQHFAGWFRARIEFTVATLADSIRELNARR